MKGTHRAYRNRIRSGRGLPARAILQRVPASREGCAAPDRQLSYRAAIDDLQNDYLLVVERWEDQASLSAHLEAADTVAFVNRWRGRMRSNIEKYDVSNKRGLMD